MKQEPNMNKLMQMIANATDAQELPDITPENLFRRPAGAVAKGADESENDFREVGYENGEAVETVHRPGSGLNFHMDIEATEEEMQQLMDEDTPVDSLLDCVSIGLVMNDGQVCDCMIISTFEYRNEKYLVLYPTDPEEEPFFAILRYHLESDGELIIEEIESDEEYDEIEDYFLDLLDS